MEVLSVQVPFQRCGRRDGGRRRGRRGVVGTIIQLSKLPLKDAHHYSSEGGCYTIVEVSGCIIKAEEVLALSSSQPAEHCMSLGVYV